MHSIQILFFLLHTDNYKQRKDTHAHVYTNEENLTQHLIESPDIYNMYE